MKLLPSSALVSGHTAALVDLYWCLSTDGFYSSNLREKEYKKAVSKHLKMASYQDPAKIGKNRIWLITPHIFLASETTALIDDRISTTVILILLVNQLRLDKIKICAGNIKMGIYKMPDQSFVNTQKFGNFRAFFTILILTFMAIYLPV